MTEAARRARAHRLRGAVMVETAIVVSAVLTLMLGALQLGIVGFLQLTVDAATFLNAHQVVISSNDPSGPATATTNTIFPQIVPPYISNQVIPAPAPSVYVDYGYNGTAAEQSASSSNRYGGASMMAPYSEQSTIVKPALKILGQQINVRSVWSEPFWLEQGAHWNASNEANGGSDTSSFYRSNYFAKGENVPPYFMAGAFMVRCDGGTSCSSPTMLALGLGNNLNVYNWGNKQPGVSGQSLANDSTTTGTFQTMACHQRMYASLTSLGSALSFGFDLNWVEFLYQIPKTNNYSLDFSKWQAFTWTLYGNLQAPIDAIYSWDQPRFVTPPLGGQPGATPLHPERGC